MKQIIIILAVFLLATGLTSVMYLAGNKNLYPAKSIVNLARFKALSEKTEKNEGPCNG